MLFVIKSSFLILSPVFFSLFFLRDCQSFQMRDANFLSRVILVVVSSFEAFWNSSWSTFTHSKLPKNITTCHLQRVLEYGLPCKGLFTFCRCINDNKFAAEFKVSLYSGEAGLTLTNVIAAHSTIHACDEFRDFWHAPHFSFLRRLFSYMTGILFLCLTASVFAVVQGDAIWIHLVLLQKAGHGRKDGSEGRRGHEIFHCQCEGIKKNAIYFKGV